MNSRLDWRSFALIHCIVKYYLPDIWGSCGLGGGTVVYQHEIGGLIPGSTCQSVLGKIMNPKLPLVSQCVCARVCAGACVCERVNEKQCKTALSAYLHLHLLKRSMKRSLIVAAIFPFLHII